MLVRGDVDAISGFYFTSLLNLRSLGVDQGRPEDLAVQPTPAWISTATA
ncbi:MAG: hypothetical protein U5L06_02270 [Rhodovibrio sp.]|nr:hypothetical protein [Rhodovibrio sp.]